jgi:hypothetical protein
LETPLPGHVWLRKGDIVKTNHQNCVVVKIGVEGCNAKVVPLTREIIEGTTRFGKSFSFKAPPGDPVTISAQVEPEFIIGRMGSAAVEKFLSQASSGQRRKQQTQEQIENMKKIQKTEKGYVSYKGRSQRIAALVAAKKTDAQILETIANEFPGSAQSDGKAAIESARKKLATAAKAPAGKSASKVAAKSAAKKSAKKSVKAAVKATVKPAAKSALPPPPKAEQASEPDAGE